MHTFASLWSHFQDWMSLRSYSVEMKWLISSQPSEFEVFSNFIVLCQGRHWNNRIFLFRWQHRRYWNTQNLYADNVYASITHLLQVQKKCLLPSGCGCCGGQKKVWHTLRHWIEKRETNEQLDLPFFCQRKSDLREEQLNKKSLTPENIEVPHWTRKIFPWATFLNHGCARGKENSSW